MFTPATVLALSQVQASSDAGSGALSALRSQAFSMVTGMVTRSTSGRRSKRAVAGASANAA
jgi:hypothetical protein